MWKYSLSSGKISISVNGKKQRALISLASREGNKNACIYAWNLSEFERVSIGRIVGTIAEAGYEIRVSDRGR